MGQLPYITNGQSERKYQMVRSIIYGLMAGYWSFDHLLCGHEVGIRVLGLYSK